MNLRYFVLPALLLLMLSGCTHFSIDPQKENASSPFPDGSTDKILHNGQLIDRAGKPASDLAATGDEETNSAVDSNEETGSNLGPNSKQLGLDPVSTQKIQTDLDEALELCELSQEYWQEGELENAVSIFCGTQVSIASINSAYAESLSVTY